MATEKYLSIQKLDGGFIVEYNDDTSDHRKILRKLPELVTLVKTLFKDEPAETVAE